MQRAKDALRCPVVLFCGQQESAKEEEEEEEEEEEQNPWNRIDPEKYGKVILVVFEI
jgi:uncharacterized Zn finger protein (UPF0148 family)